MHQQGPLAPQACSLAPAPPAWPRRPEAPATDDIRSSNLVALPQPMASVHSSDRAPSCRQKSCIPRRRTAWLEC